MSVKEVAVYGCDRCALHESATEIRDRTRAPEGWERVQAGPQLKGPHSQSPKTYDLCPTCAKLFCELLGKFIYGEHWLVSS